jgi:hypothetical protein
MVTTKRIYCLLGYHNERDFKTYIILQNPNIHRLQEWLLVTPVVIFWVPNGFLSYKYFD